MQGSVGTNQTSTTTTTTTTTGAASSAPSATASNNTTTPQPQQQQQQHQQPAKNQSNSSNSTSNPPPPSSNGGDGGARNNHQHHTGAAVNIDVPVRILVPSESVGAIIGKGGQTIRQLTQQTRAKVDVYRGEMMTPSNALQEKVITIRGQPDNCVNACREILKVMKADSESKGKSFDMPLKVLAHNDYIGRIIGKQGDTINSIKRDTDTTVTVSSVNDMSMNVERVITIKGELENAIRALAIIHAKIRSAFENDSKTYGHQALLMSTIPQMPMLASHAATASYHHLHHQHGVKAQAAQNGGGANYASGGQLIGQPGQLNPPAGVQQVNPAAVVAAGTSHHHSNFTGYYPPPLIHHLTALSAGSTHSHHHSVHTGYSPSGQPINGGHVAAPGGHMVGNYNNVSPPHVPSSHGGGYLAPHQMGGSGGHQSSSMPGNDYGAPSPNITNGSYPGPEKVFLYLPSTAVGAIIGAKGSYIKNLIKLSGASIKIAPVPATDDEQESKNVSERQVIIAGLPDSQCKAQFYIYEKIRQERFTTDDNVKLRAEIAVPASKIGRLIGRAGKNVKEIQRSTGATIKLPDETVQSHQARSKGEQGSNSDEAATENKIAAATDDEKPENPSTEGVANEKTTDGAETAQTAPGNEYVMVGIIGTFNSSQLAQRRIQALVNSTTPHSMRFEAPVNGGGDSHYHHHENGGKGGSFYQPKANGGFRKGRGGHHGNRANRDGATGKAESATAEETASAPETAAVSATVNDHSEPEPKLEPEQPAAPPAVTA